MKIKVCIPYYLEYESCKPGLEELKGCKEHEFVPIFGQGYDPGLSRNKMISNSQAMQQDLGPAFDYHLFIDSDMNFSLNQVLALIKRDVDIVSAAYLWRDDPKFYNGGVWNKECPGDIEKRIIRSQKGLIQPDCVGGGFLLVKTAALSKMEYPWFRRHIIVYKGRAAEIQEDYGFCLNAAAVGLKVHMDCDVVVEHILEQRAPAPPQPREEDFIPAPGLMNDEAMAVITAITRWMKKYNLCYGELLKANDRST